MTKKEINVILELHKKWLDDNEDGKCANFSGANLRGANFSGTNVSFANFSGANVSFANFSGANFSGANLRYANLSNANLSDAKLDNIIYNEATAFFALQCPEEGSFIGWKKCIDNTIVKLLILEDAKRSSGTSRKCRCSKVKVLEIYNENDNKVEVAISDYDKDFIYRVNEVVEVKDFDDDRWNECSKGIHFFLTKKEAENYY